MFCKIQIFNVFGFNISLSLSLIKLSVLMTKYFLFYLFLEFFIFIPRTATCERKLGKVSLEKEIRRQMKCRVMIEYKWHYNYWYYSIAWSRVINKYELLHFKIFESNRKISLRRKRSDLNLWKLCRVCELRYKFAWHK